MNQTTKLRKILSTTDVTPVLEVCDALSAMIAARAGYNAVYVSRTSVANTLLARPNGDTVTLTELEFMVARTARATPIPVLVDIGDGFGNAVNVAHTTQILAQAGASGIIVDDAGKSGGIESSGPKALSIEEMDGKVRAVIDNRPDSDFVVIARSGAFNGEGIGKTVERIKRYVSAGADGFVAANIHAKSELEALIASVSASIPLISVGGSGAPQPSELARLGFRGALYADVLLHCQAAGMLEFFMEFFEKGNAADLALLRKLENSPFEDWYQFTGFDGIRAMEERYLPSEEVVRRYESPDAAHYYQPSSSRSRPSGAVSDVTEKSR